MNTTMTCQPKEATTENTITYSQPRYYVDQSMDDTLVQIELPGVSKDELNLTVENKEILVEGSASYKLPENWKVLHRESKARAYRLRLRIGDQVDQAAIKAQLSDGVLTVTLPKAEAAKPQKVKIT